MTLYDITQAIESIAEEQPAVNAVVRDDIYQLNDHPDWKYGVFGYVQGQHSNVGEGFIRYGFTLVYADRINEEQDNIQLVQSTGVQVLSNILYTLEDEFPVSVAEGVTYEVFGQRFSDNCAGVMATVGIIVPRTTICAVN